jgi:hypothetical protein
MKSHFAALLCVLVVCGSCAGPTDDSSSSAKSNATQNPEQSASPAQSWDEIVRDQIRGNWIVDAGMAGLEDMVVVIFVEMNRDGSVQSAQIDRSTARDDPNWQVFAESCRRAIFRSSPLRMPADKPYQAWKTIRLKFSGRELSRE